jgi:hypothetical protein
MGDSCGGRQLQLAAALGRLKAAAGPMSLSSTPPAREAPLGGARKLAMQSCRAST